MDVELSRQASRFLDKADHTLAGRITEKLESLRFECMPADARRITLLENAWRIRVGDYRIIYRVYEKERIILVMRIDHRSRVYDRVT